MMKFDIMGLVFMVVAIWVGNFAGPMLGGYFGAGAGLLGAFVTGIIIYAVYSLITGSKMTLFGAVIFAVCVYISVMVTGMVTGMSGLLTGWVAIFVQAIILSLIYSWIAPKGESAKVPVKL